MRVDGCDRGDPGALAAEQSPASAVADGLTGDARRRSVLRGALAGDELCGVPGWKQMGRCPVRLCVSLLVRPLLLRCISMQGTPYEDFCC